MAPPAEDLHHFDTASWRLLTSAVADEGLKQSVLFVVTYRQASASALPSHAAVKGTALPPFCGGLRMQACGISVQAARQHNLCPSRPARRPYFGVLSPALRQRGGSYELLYHHVRAAYRAVLAQVRPAPG